MHFLVELPVLTVRQQMDLHFVRFVWYDWILKVISNIFLKLVLKSVITPQLYHFITYFFQSLRYWALHKD